MKIYNLKGCIIENKLAVIAVSLPVPKNGNRYFIFDIHSVSKNAILIHFKDLTGKTLTGTGDNFEPFFVDLTDSKFNNIDFSKKIDVVLCHENNDVLKGTPKEIFNSEMSQPFSKSILGPNTTGNGTIRGE